MNDETAYFNKFYHFLELAITNKLKAKKLSKDVQRKSEEHHL